MVEIGPVATGLLTELNKEAQILATRARELNQARANYDIASRKYAAVRDMVTEFLGVSPYDESIKWPSEAIQQTHGQVYKANRFIHLKPGDAAVFALKELKQPSTLEEISKHLASGGLQIGPRGVNASLMRTAGVEKLEDGRYRYEETSQEAPPMDDVDDLPF